MKIATPFVLLLVAVIVFTYGVTRWGVSRQFVARHDQMIDQIGRSLLENEEGDYARDEVISILSGTRREMYSLLGVKEGLRSLTTTVLLALALFLVGVRKLLSFPRIQKSTTNTES